MNAEPHTHEVQVTCPYGIITRVEYGDTSEAVHTSPRSRWYARNVRRAIRKAIRKHDRDSQREPIRQDQLQELERWGNEHRKDFTGFRSKARNP